MKRIILSSLLTVGLVFLAGNSAFAQRHGGGGGLGANLNGNAGGNVGGNVGGAVHNAAPAIQHSVENTAPSVRNDAHADVRNDAHGDVRNDARNDARNDVRGDVRNGANRGNLAHGEHPFYGNDRGRDNDWRYRWNDGRWWYWTPLNAWASWNDGRWSDYSQPYTTYYRGATAAPSGWYWSNDQHQWYWFNGTTLQAAPQ